MTHDPREALEAERAELIAKNESATSWGAAVGARSERIKEIDMELARLGGAPLEALSNLIAYFERNECTHEGTHRGGSIWTICDECGRKWSDDRDPFVPYKEPAEVTAALAAIDALVPAGGVGEARNSCRHGRWDCTDCDKGWNASLAPQNAGGENTNPVLGAESASGAHVAGRTAGANPATGAKPSEATPAPAPADEAKRLLVRRLVDDPNSASGQSLQYVEVPAPAEGAAVAGILPPETVAWSFIDYNQVPASLHDALTDLVRRARNDTRPAKAVDVEAIKRAIWQLRNGELDSDMCAHIADVLEAALLRDSNASSDKGKPHGA